MSGIATAIAVSAGATIYSGKKSSDAAKSAANTQSKATEAGIEEQRRQFDITQSNLQPFQQAGEAALEQQRILLGFGSTPQTDPNAQRRLDIQSQIDALTRGLGSNTSSGLAGLASRAAQKQNQARLSDLQSQLSSIPEFTTQTIDPREQQRQAFEAFNESPGQRFLRERQEKALLRNTSAIGGLGGGNVRTALQEQAAGIAQQDFQNQFGRLGQLAGQGQSAVTNIGQFGAQTAGNIANLGVAGSQARASGILGAAQSRSNTVNQLMGLGGMALGYLNQPQTQFNPGSFFGGTS